MILFSKVRMKNFFSVGNFPIDINFDIKKKKKNKKKGNSVKDIKNI